MAGRPSHRKALSVWVNGLRAATWVLPTRGPQELHYDTEWVQHALGRPLSLSLPFSFGNAPVRGAAVENYFDNLLPDRALLRTRIAQRFHTASDSPFDLLSAVGRDCVGAIQLLGEDQTPQGLQTIRGRVLTEAGVERHLRRAALPRGFGAEEDEPDDEFRLSLAGAQEKTALLYSDGQWMVPHGATPTTHIMKLPLGLVGGRQADFTTSVDNEWLCLKLLEAFGLPVAQADIARFGSQRVLVVERFDRRLADSGDWILRLPQEDFCQVMARSSLQKYESDGGPGLADLFERLNQSAAAAQDMRTLMASQILFWMLRAPDGHAKNFSVHLLPRGAFHLAPLYDVMSAWPVLGEGGSQWSPHGLKLAMALLGKSRHNRMEQVQRRHFNSTAQKVGFGESAEPVIEQLLSQVPQALYQVQQHLPADFNQRVLDTVLGGLESSAKALSNMPAQALAPGSSQAPMPEMPGR